MSVIGRTAFWGSYSPMVTLISPPGEREKWFGFLGALRNAGFAVGGVVAGVALTVDSTGALLRGRAAERRVVRAVLRAARRRDASTSPRAAAATAIPRRSSAAWGTVLRDRGYRWLVASNFGYAMTSAALNVAIPVYVVEMLGLPGWVSAAVFVINTLMIGVGQGVVVQRMTGAVRARIVALGAILTAASFLVMWGAGPLGVVAASAVVLVAAVVYTLGELVAGPVLATLAAESPPPALRGRYIATYQLSWNVATGVAPLLYAWLLDLGSAPAWLGLTAIALLGASATVPMRRRMEHAGRVVTNRAETVARLTSPMSASQAGASGRARVRANVAVRCCVVLVDDHPADGRVAQRSGRTGNRSSEMSRVRPGCRRPRG